MDFSFTLFEPHRNRTATLPEPKVEIRPNGRIVFNKLAAELLSHTPFCMIGYDASQQAIGVLPLAEKHINAFPVRYAANGAYIGAKKFFKHFNILPQTLIEQAPLSSGDYIGIRL